MSTLEGRALGAALARIARLEERMAGLSTPQLVHSSIEGGAVKIRGDSGELAGQVGRQFDATFGAVTLAGPLPPKPSVLPSNVTVTPIAGGLRLRYDGSFDPAFLVSDDPDVAPTPVSAPQDFSRFEVHSDQTDSFTGLLWLTLRRTIESPRGGEVEFGVPQDTDIWVRLVSRTAAGRTTASDVIGPFRAGKVGEGDIDLDFGVFGGTTVYYGTAAPTPGIANNYGDLYLQEVDDGPPPVYRTYRWYPDDTWKLLSDQGANDALAAAILAQQAADSKAKVFYEDTMPSWTGVAGSALWYDTDDGNRAYSFDGTTFVSRRLGNGAIQPASLIASDLIATGTVSATLLESVLVLATEIVGGDPNASHVKLSPLGLELFRLNRDGAVQRRGGLGTGDDGLNFVDDDGETSVAILPTGAAALRQLAVSGIDEDGDGIIDGGFQVYGRQFNEWLDEKAGGIEASAFFNNAGGGVFASGITTPFGLAEMSFTAKAGRTYLVLFDGFHYSATANGSRGVVHLRATIDGSAPTINTGIRLGSKMINMPTTGQSYSTGAIMAVRTFSQTADVQVRVVPIVQVLNGGGSMTVHTYNDTDNWNAPFQLIPIDIGKDVPETFILNDAGGTRAGYTTAPTPSAKKTYTTTWGASFVGAYYGNTNLRTDTTDMVQGQTIYWPSGGNQRSIVGFTGNGLIGEASELTKTITAALSGATVKSVEIYVYCVNSHYDWGGRLQIGYHGNTSAPPNYPPSAYNAFGTATVGQGQGRWITLPSSTHANWASGTYRGFTIGPGTTTAGDYYVRLAGAGPRRPAIRITYTR